MSANGYEDVARLAGGSTGGLTGGLPDTWSPSTAGAVAVGPASAPRRARPECGFAGCTAPWSRLWRRTGRPVFDGQWGCSRGCLRGLIEAAVRRETADGNMGAATEAHRHRVPLGLVLLAQGWITHPQLQHALAAQKAAGRGRIGDWLVEECGVEQGQVTRGLGVQWNRPVLAPVGFDARSMALVMPAGLREQLRAVPLRVAANRILYMGFDDGVDAAVAMALERMSGLQVESGLMNASDFRRSEVRLRERATVECAEEFVDNHEALCTRMVAALTASQPVEARLVRVRGAYWLRMWLEPGASGVAGLLPRTGEDVLDRLYSVRDGAGGLA